MATQKLAESTFTPPPQTFQDAEAQRATDQANNLAFASTLKTNAQIGAPPTNDTINASQIGQQPMTVPQATPMTQAEGLLGAIDEQANQYAQSVVDSQKLQQEKNTTTGLLGKITAKLSGQKGVNQLQDENYGEVDAAQKELNDINDKVRISQRAQTNELRALQSAGLTDVQRGAREREINRQAAFEQADLSLIQLAKQNNYSAAKEIADRKVSAQLEQQKNELETLQFIYQENKEQFTKSEQRQFEVQQAERARLLQLQESELKNVNDIVLEALKNGAPADIAQKAFKAASMAEAIGLIGEYTSAGNELLTPAQAKSLKVPYGTTKAEAAAMGITPTTARSSSSRSNSSTIKLTNDEKNRISALGITNTPVEFQNIVVNALTTKEAKDFIAAWKAEQARRRQSIDPVIFLEQWAAGQDESTTTTTTPKKKESTTETITNPFKTK